MADTDEQTPLIQVVRVAPRRQRYSHSTIRRFCSSFLGITLVIVVILFLLPLRWLPWRDPNRHHHHHNHTSPEPPAYALPPKSWPWGYGLNYTELQDVLLNTPEAEKCREWSQYYTAGPHLAGKNVSQAIWTKEKWQEFGVEDVGIVAYEVYINYPVDHRLALLRGKGENKEEINVEVDKKKSEYDVIYEAILEEDILPDDPTTALEDRIPTFHGYSASGNITAQYGQLSDGSRQGIL